MENFINNKKTASLKAGSIELLNKQIVLEAKASASYLAMASWCDVNGYKHAASFLYAQSDEERGHMLRIFHYLNDAGSHGLVPDITNIQQDFNNLHQIFTLVLEHEIQVSQAIHRIAQYCLMQDDMATFTFIQWFIKEQIEEETTMRQILDLFQIMGQEGMALYFIDKEIGTLRGN